MFKLMNWQKNVRDHFRNNPDIKNCVVIAGTGCGKTHTGAECVSGHFVKHSRDIAIVAVPYRGIKKGWAKALRQRGLEVADKPSQLASDTQVVVTTYAGASGVIRYIATEQPSRNVFFVLDEFHHLEEMNSWAAPFLSFDENRVSRRLLMSGTPWHEKGELPREWIQYETVNGERCVVLADPAICKYTYGQNVNEDDDQRNTVRVQFRPFRAFGLERVGDDVRPYDTNDSVRSEGLTKYVGFNSYEELLECDALMEMLQHSDEVLQVKREAMPDCGGIVFVSSQPAGRAVQDWFREVLHKHAHLVVSDDPLAHKTLEAFENNADEWLVSVDMVSEGVDVPRLRVVCDLSNRSTLLHIIQRWGRVLRRARYSDGKPRRDDVDAYICHIDHAQLRYVAEKIEEDVQRNRREGGEGGDPPPIVERERLTQNGEKVDSIFRGQHIEDDVERIASNILRTNYNNIMSDGLGLVGALNMARYLLRKGDVPEELMREWAAAQDGDESKPQERVRTKDEIVRRYTRVTNHIIQRCFDGDAAAAMQEIAHKQGIGNRKWSKDNQTKDALERRYDACKAVFEELTGEVWVDD